MITIFNRKELLVTFDIKKQSDVRDILSANGINYIVKVVDRQNSSLFGNSRARVGSLGMNANVEYGYKIFVHKNDYDMALNLVR